MRVSSFIQAISPAFHGNFELKPMYDEFKLRLIVLRRAEFIIHRYNQSQFDDAVPQYCIMLLVGWPLLYMLLTAGLSRHFAIITDGEASLLGSAAHIGTCTAIIMLEGKLMCIVNMSRHDAYDKIHDGIIERSTYM